MSDTALAGDDFENPTAELASSPTAQILKFEREDWTSFRTIEGVQQKAGVTKDLLPRLVLKELADNALDVGGMADVGEFVDDGGYFVEDDGPGIDGTPEDIARLFSIRRPMVSSKLLRLPTRGALGNGLRVVAGVVLASEGSLTVVTKNRRIELRPERDGSTTVVKVCEVEYPVGTRIEISFGPSLPYDQNALRWAKVASAFASGNNYRGRSSPHWYDVPQFRELLDASGELPVRELIAQLDGCTGGKAGEIVDRAGLSRAICKNVTEQEAKDLLTAAQRSAKPVNPERLGKVGAERFSYHSHSHVAGTVKVGSCEIPCVVEAWAKAAAKMELSVCVNRTPITGSIRAYRDERDIQVFGCGLRHIVAEAPKEARFDIWLNIIVPFMPITSDGKAPNLEPFANLIGTVLSRAVRKAHRPNAGSGMTQKDVVLDNIAAVIADVSGDGEYRFNARQLFYGLRPIVMKKIDQELQIANFTGILADYEDEHGEIAGMYHEPRGSIYHPHRGETITLGTLMVEQYERPPWNYNKLVYIEKEGANEALKAVRWPERHDCMPMSSKGYSTRAARDLIDKLAEHDEPIKVYAVTDADAYGSMIQQTLQEATKVRKARKIKIVNLGLYPWEAIEMGLEVETVEPKKNKSGEPQRKPIADYVRARDAAYPNEAPGGISWEEWLQTHRVELNAMTTPQFIEWLDAKMAEHGGDKLIPPLDVLESELDERIEAKVRAAVTERILREAGLERQVKTAIAAIKKPTAAALAAGIKDLFKNNPDREWRDHIETIATKKLEK